MIRVFSPCDNALRRFVKILVVYYCKYYLRNFYPFKKG